MKARHSARPLNLLERCPPLPRQFHSRASPEPTGPPFALPRLSHRRADARAGFPITERQGSEFPLPVA
jgi:hypothetical protein